MKYRILAVALIACLLLCGCGAKEPAATEPVKAPGGEPVPEEITEPVEQKEPVSAEDLTVENAPITLAQLQGDWHLDGDYTEKTTGMSLEDFYGALWEEENILNFAEDGTTYYIAGICYGNGKYRVTENGILVEYAGEEDEDDAGFNLLTVERGDVLRIGMDQYGDGNLVWWVKTA